MANDPDTEKNMKCPLCQDFLSDPTTIPCGHNFCIGCIQRCWDMKVYSGTFTCPQCKQTFNRRPSLSKNTTLACMIQDLQEHKRKLPTAESMKIQRDIVDIKEKLKKITRGKEEDLDTLRAAVVSLEQSAEAALRDSEGIFNELLNIWERARERHRENIKTRKRALLTCAEKEEKLLIGRISTLKRKDAELDSLVPHTWSSGQFYQKLQEINSDLQQCTQVAVNREFFSFVKTDLDSLKDTIVDKWNGALESLQEQVNDVQLFQAPQVEPRSKPDKAITFKTGLKKDNMKDSGPTIPTREQQASHALKPVPSIRRSLSVLLPKSNTYVVDKKPAGSSVTRLDLLHHVCLLSLNPETAHPFLRLSEDKRVTWVSRRQHRNSVTKAFDHWEQVLCMEGLVGGLCYWEAEWRGKSVFIGVTLDGLCRKGKGLECGLGHNASSWCLHCTDGQFTAWHNNTNHEIMTKTFSPRIGVFLDQLEGTLTFYSISLNAATVLYRFKAQNLCGLLYPGFGVGKESSVKLCQLEKT